MNRTLLAVLSEKDRLLVAETEPAQLALLDEDGALALHRRIRKARNKYSGQYRRQASARVAAEGGRGKARPKNKRAALRTEAYEEALARVSRRLGTLSARSASELRTQRIAAARGATARPAAKKSVRTSAAKKAAGAGGPKKSSAAKRSVTDRPRGDRSLKSPASVKRKATTKAAGARRQAKRDSR
jgi:hypothetical protein